MVLAIIAFVIFTVVGVNWIYERNEPAFMTPIVDKIAPFLPSKGAYGKQTQSLQGSRTRCPASGREPKKWAAAIRAGRDRDTASQDYDKGMKNRVVFARPRS